ncbi:hypothetical protein PV10_08947 [Exophiala mesophila]|uniref:Uncharacterized protein n=1 Tax=Exophiala mesophila TaxID=212818 RepID=A0A0D1ZRH1_EXOME|nr:uncharacterized protein PV10_08947 [Exophiala mesophila]KIV89373.1 hypothetical protein PV10_08947 [Exophiala mesophila]
MAVITPKSPLHARSEASSQAFSVIFAAIALLIILVCAFWGFVLPRLRRKSQRHRSFRSTATQSYQDDYHDEPHYLNHPPVFHSSQGRLSPGVRRYNPRTESPFPRVFLGSAQKPLVPPVSNTSPTTSSHDLFLPSREGFPPTDRNRPLNQTGCTHRHGAEKNDIEMLLFGPETDDILPVPEPLVLKPRPAGRPPPLTRQLERFPMPLDISRSRKPRLHFGPRSPACATSAVILRADLADCPRNEQNLTEPSASPASGTTTKMTRIQQRMKKIPDASQNLDDILYDPFVLPKSQTSRNKSHSLPVSAALNEPRPRRWRGLLRAGTVTRPQTPVAEMRDVFDKSSSASKTEDMSNQIQQTPSVQLFSKSIVFSTPPTSPLSVNDERMPISRDSSHGHGIVQYTPPAVWSDGKKSLVEMFCSRSDSVAPLRPQTSGNRENWRNKGSVPNHGTRHGSRPARLSLSVLSNFRAANIGGRRHSASSLATTPKQLISTVKGANSVQASSTYSRDATALDFSDSPVRGVTQVIENLHTTVEPKVICMELVRSKIDNWDLHTGTLAPPTIKSQDLKRAEPNLGTRDLTGIEVRPGPEWV